VVPRLRPATYPHVKCSNHKLSSSSTLCTFATRDLAYKMGPGYSVLHLSESPIHYAIRGLFLDTVHSCVKRQEANVHWPTSRQTKPGGWIEVVETGPVEARLYHFSKASSIEQSPTDRPTHWGSVSYLPTSDETVLLIKRQLLSAGFVDVEERGWRSASSTAGICHRIAGAARCFKSWCLGFLGLRWNCDSSLSTSSGEIQITVDEKGLSSSCSTSR